jgi:hypothetical protein
MVHCRRVPAGRRTSRALAVKVKEKTTSKATAKDAWSKADFILHLWVADVLAGRLPDPLYVPRI